MREFGRFGPLIGAIDEGTSNVKFLVNNFVNFKYNLLCYYECLCFLVQYIRQVFAANTSEVLTYHQILLKRFSPREGWVEQDALEILNAVLECIEVNY